MNQDLADSELLLRIRECKDSEKQEIFVALYERYKQLVVRICYYETGDYEEAADLLQDVFVKVLESAETIRHPELFKCWLMRVTRNLCADRLRGVSPKRQQSLSPAIELSTESRVEDRYAAQLDSQKLLGQLVACLKKLEPGDLNIFKLRWKGLRAMQIAKLLNADRAALRRSYDRIKYNVETCMKAKGLSVSMDQIMTLGELDD